MTVKTLVEGLQIILKYDPEAEMNADHDQIYAGDTDKMEAMTPEDRKQLEDQKWFTDDTYDCWCHFV